MVIFGENLAKRLLEVGKIDDHAVFRLAFNDDFDFIGVSVEAAALGVIGQKVRAIDVLRHTKFHGVRIAQAQSEGW